MTNSWFNNRSKIRCDKRHASAHRAQLDRRLSIEHCEGRLMLSGSSLTLELANPPTAIDGGFLTINAGGFLNQNANNFLFDFKTENSLLGTQWHAQDVDLMSGSYLFHTHEDTPTFQNFDDDRAFDFVDTSSISPELPLPVAKPIVPTNNVPTNSAPHSNNSPPIGPVQKTDRHFLHNSEIATAMLPTATAGPGSTAGPGHYQPDLSELDDEQVSPAATDNSDAHLDDRQSPFTFSRDSQTDDFPNNESAYFQNSVRLLNIAGPEQVASSEGGAIEVAAAMQATQHAYETQLSVVVATNLDRNDDLPTFSSTPAKPLDAELARPVVFETVGQHKVAQASNTVQPTQDHQIDFLAVSSATSGPISSQQDTAVANRPANVSRGQKMAERVEVEEEQPSAHAATFAQWPAFAAVTASYLLVERRRPARSNAVQMPPRRSNRSS